jgi:hypothetical protein
VSTDRPARQRVGPSASGTTPRASRPSASGGTAPKAPRPLPAGSSLFTPNASPARQAAERHSARPLLFLHQLPSWVPPIVLAVLLVVGLAVKGPGGAVALGAVAAILGWLAAVSWPRLSSGGRTGRVLVIAVVAVLSAYQATR